MGLLKDLKKSLEDEKPNKAEKLIMEIINSPRVYRKVNDDLLDDFLSLLFRIRLKRKDKDGALRVLDLTKDPISMEMRKEKYQKKFDKVK